MDRTKLDGRPMFISPSVDKSKNPTQFKVGITVNYRPPGELPAPGGTSYNGLYGDALFERGTVLRLEVYKREGISQVAV